MLLIFEDVLTVFHLFPCVADSGAETILEISRLQEDLGGFIMETITLSNQGAIATDLGMPISFWTPVCVLKTIYLLWLDLDVMSLWLKTMYVAVILYGYLSRWCFEKDICCWRCINHEI